MFLAFRLLLLELRRDGCISSFLQYKKALCKVETNSLRINFLESCLRADIIPNFLRFRVPNNGCFDDKSVHDFKKRLLRKEIFSAKRDLDTSKQKVSEKRQGLQSRVANKLIPSIALFVRNETRILRIKQRETHKKKLESLSIQQDRPLLTVSNTVISFGLTTKLPKIVSDTLSLGPKSAVLDKINPKNVLAELDLFLEFCKKQKVTDDIITDINIKTLAYNQKFENFRPIF